MKNAFDLSANSKLIEELKKSQRLSSGATKNVQKKRAQGIEPMRINLKRSGNLDPRLFTSELPNKIKQG